MGRRPVSASFVTPLSAVDGSAAPAAPGTDANLTGKGVFTLAVGTWYIPLAGDDANFVAGQMQWDANMAGNVRVEDTCAPRELVSDWADGSTNGCWVDEDPTTAFVGTVGAGASVTNGVLTLTAGNQGGALWNVAETGARRLRLKVVVTTQGEARFFGWGKE
jgi:hypothetical protein